MRRGCIGLLSTAPQIRLQSVNAADRARVEETPSQQRTWSPEDLAAYHRAMQEWQWTQQHFAHLPRSTSEPVLTNRNTHTSSASSSTSSGITDNDVLDAKRNGGLVVLAVVCAGLFTFVQQVKGSVYEELLQRTPTVHYDDAIEQIRKDRLKGGEEAVYMTAIKAALQGAFLQKMMAKVKREQQQYVATSPKKKS